MNRILIFPFILILSGCPGGKPAPQPRATFIDGERLCFSVDKQDVLNYYRIESNQDKAFSIVRADGELKLSYPEDCIKVGWVYGHSYVISYGLNGQHYVYRFYIDNNG